VLIHIGAAVMVWLGHCRSSILMGGKAVYFVAGCFNMIVYSSEGTGIVIDDAMVADPLRQVLAF
jgi:hypothetical protein